MRARSPDIRILCMGSLESNIIRIVILKVISRRTDGKGSLLLIGI